MKCLCSITLVLLLLAQIPVVSAWQVERNAICKSIGLDNTPVDETTSFLDTDEHVIIWTKIKKDVPETLLCRDEIYSPDGVLYDWIEFELPEENDLIWTTGWIKGFWMGELSGTWNVKRYVENTLILDENFTITYTRPKLRLVDKSPLDVSLHPGDTISYTFTLQNIGTAPATQVELLIESITPENGLSLLELTPPKDLAVGAQDNWTIRLEVEEPGTYTISTFFMGFYGVENFLGENYVYITGENFHGSLAENIVYLDEEIITVSSTLTPRSEPFTWWIVVLVVSIVLVAVVVWFKKGRKAQQ